MPLKSHRAADNVWSCKKDADRALLSARSQASAQEKQTSYRRMFEEKPKTARRSNPSLTPRYTQTTRSVGDTLDSSLTVRGDKQRLAGGANVCDNSDKGYICRRPLPCPPKMTNPKVNIMHINMPVKPEPRNICYKMKDNRTRGTQTLYRESSAQTLPYLPGVLNDEPELEKLELFKLPTILPGDGPPGLYEVEVLERARKRWAFKQALRIQFQNYVRDMRDDLKKAEHKMILEAFEWEHWIEREEHIQECQMMRLELLIRMFDKREREMHDASKERIEKSFKLISEKRDNRLRKNEMEFGRAIRRLEMKHRKIPRNWRKENITKELGDPSSEFYAPLMRYGVNPNRRHFPGTRKDFEDRIYMLEKRSMAVKNLECPFEKINAWAKPKTRVIELEKNFCSEKNLKNLYDSLKTLRLLAEKPKEAPRCLVEKTPPSSERSSAHTLSSWVEPNDFHFEEGDGMEEMLMEQERSPRKLVCKDKRGLYKSFLEEKRREEIENLLIKYEGTTIGWLMRFLAQEQQRLMEQRKMHLISLIAQKERCRREVLAALLERKENEMRENFEKLYVAYESANDQVCRDFLDDIFEIDPKVKADKDATEYITELAKLIDKDIQRWLKSFECIQNPLNYEPLRQLLKNLIFPNPEEFMAAAEPGLIVQYIIEELLAHVFELLEPYDICTYTANHTVDRLIDNDLEYFTSECSCCSDDEVVKCTEPQREAMAILRKVIRRAVPGRRWMTEKERLVHSNIEDIIDLALDNAFITSERPSTRYTVRTVHSELSYWDLMCDQRPKEDDAACSSSSDDQFERKQVIADFSHIHAKDKRVVEQPSEPEAEVSSESEGPVCATVSHPAERELENLIITITGPMPETSSQARAINEDVDIEYLHRFLLCIIKRIAAAAEMYADDDEDDFDDLLGSSTDSACSPETKEDDAESTSSSSSSSSSSGSLSCVCSICRCDTSDEDWFIRSQSEYERDQALALEQLKISSDEEDEKKPSLTVPLEPEDQPKKTKSAKKKKVRKSASPRICPKCRICDKKKRTKVRKPKPRKCLPCECDNEPRVASEIDFARTDMDSDTLHALAITLDDEDHFDMEGTLPIELYAVPKPIEVKVEEDLEIVSSAGSFSCLIPNLM